MSNCKVVMSKGKELEIVKQKNIGGVTMDGASKFVSHVVSRNSQA